MDSSTVSYNEKYVGKMFKEIYMSKDMLDLIQQKNERVKEKAGKTLPERKKGMSPPAQKAHTVIIKSRVKRQECSP